MEHTDILFSIGIFEREPASIIPDIYKWLSIIEKQSWDTISIKLFPIIWIYRLIEEWSTVRSSCHAWQWYASFGTVLIISVDFIATTEGLAPYETPS